MTDSPTQEPAPGAEANEQQIVHNVQRWVRQVRMSRALALGLSIAAIVSAIATYMVLTSADASLGPDPEEVIALILGNLALLVVLLGMVVRRAYSLWVALRKGTVGTRLQVRIIAMFSFVAILPTIIVSVFSAIFFSFGIQSWFDQRVSTALEESVQVAEAYLEEHKETIRADAIAMASDLRRDMHVALTAPKSFSTLLSGQAALRNLTEAIVFHPNRVIARTELSFSLAFERLPPHILEQVDAGNIVILTDDEEKIRAIVKLDDVADLYLMIGRIIDGKVLNHMVTAQGAVNEYRRLQSNIEDIQIQFSIVFILVALLLLLAAIWYGMYVAIRLVVPISQLISATERVRAGDYSSRVPVAGPKDDEISTLGRTFNRMTEQLEKQREDAMHANRQLDERRRFTEAVFEGVSPGIIALDAKQNITIYNHSAMQLLALKTDANYRGHALQDIFPEISDLVAKSMKKPNRLQQKDILIERGETKRNLHVRITVELFDDAIEGIIVTFDDITDLVSAQRSAAWADVARRIAHEIKNPLTPITLSTERLKRKYAEQINEDKDAYLRYIDTIAKHVQDIGQMVEEFVSFARMPAPEFKQIAFNDLIQKVVFSQRTAHGNITYNTSLPKHPLTLRCDENQVSRTLTNILKNAAESIEARLKETPEPAGQIDIHLEEEEDIVVLTIADNGIGFPEDKIATLTEPYVTTRAKGTGLGLAIVKKTMEDHAGNIELRNRETQGAQVTLTFSKNITLDISPN